MREIGFLLFIFIAIGVVWYWNGGPERALSRQGILFNYSANQGAVVFPVPQIAPNGRASLGSEKISATNNISTLTSALNEYREKKSPYADTVTLVRSRADSEFADEYLTIKVSPQATRPVVLTGWKLESTITNASASLPQAAQLPYVGTSNTLGPVRVDPGSTVHVVTGRSPVGTSFRTNICTGYFEQFQDFTPSLPIECPRAVDESERRLTIADQNEACDAALRSVKRCTLTIKSLPATVGTACLNLIQQDLSYNGCITTHRNDPKFYQNEWYLYLNHERELWKQRGERIKLVDESGFTVGAVEY